MNLYLCECEAGDFYVVATDPTYAKNKLKAALDQAYNELKEVELCV